MNQAELTRILDDQHTAQSWLTSIGITQPQSAHANLVRIADAGMPLELLATLCDRLQVELPGLSDPDMALNNLENFICAARSPLALGALFERDPEALPILLRMFSTSQHLSNLLVEEPEIYDLLRMTEGTPVAASVLHEELLNEIAACKDELAAQELLRSFKHRETARIAYGDIVRGQKLETVTRQISYLADTLCDAAVVASRNLLAPRFGIPRCENGDPTQFVVIGFENLGGEELSYASAIRLMFVYDEDGHTDGERQISNHEYFDRLARQLERLLSVTTERGFCYEIDLRWRPEGTHGPRATTLRAALDHYDAAGRTWERQAYVKARPVAGDLELGQEFLQRMRPWVYRRYLSRADITGIRALKRRIERRTTAETDRRDVRDGFGGIRDIEFVIQFLQLLNGSDLPEIRTTNTLEAVAQLESTGCLTTQERSILEQNYVFLRQIEHRLQIMFDLQAHTLPTEPGELTKLAVRMGYTEENGQSPLAQFESDLTESTELNRKILDHLLHDAFGADENVAPEVDLVLDPSPQPDAIESTLAPYGFGNTQAAYENLCQLAEERIKFLNTRRCRHFLASIAKPLLTAVSETPNPNETLSTLTKVSDSLGGKGVLWELFSSNPATLRLYVRLCASSPYLTTLLTSHPGMIDELLDSLLLGHAPSRESIHETLADRCRGAEDVLPIVHSFKNSMHLFIGVRDVMGLDDIRESLRALSDVAEACLQQLALYEYRKMVSKLGMPTKKAASLTPVGVEVGLPKVADVNSIGVPQAADTCDFLILALGKLGGREPNYHSDLDVIFVYEEDGPTRLRGRHSGEPTSNQHFFNQLSRRIVKSINNTDPLGRLYELDTSLRPQGSSGPLALSLEQFRQFFSSDDCRLRDRQALCKGRPVLGSIELRDQVMQTVHDAIRDDAWESSDANEICRSRLELEEDANETNLKRAAGGTMDVEFIVQALQLKHAEEFPSVLVPGTFEAIERLAAVSALSGEDAIRLAESYRFLRSVEARLRLMDTSARHDLPTEERELTRLSYLLETSADQLRRDCKSFAHQNRAMFDRLVR